jgi:CubicO group peptidase (beta-lactamase class C family)
MNCIFGLAAALVMVSAVARAGDLPKATPTEVGLSSEKLGALGPALQKLVDDGKIPGGVALVARHGKVAYIEAFGWRDIESKTAMTEDTIFAIASMSKPITAVAAMTLVDGGKLALDDPVEKYLPELKGLQVLGDEKDDAEGEIATVAAERPITVRDLFAHTSGISYGMSLGGSGGGRLERAYKKAGVTGPQNRTIADQVGRLAHAPLAHQPGAGWTYGLSHDVLGRVIEVVSGQTFDKYLQETIFKPLDMHDTAFNVPKANRDRVATVYRAGTEGKLEPLPKNYGSETFFSGGGGLFSTTRDYARFAQMLASGGELDGARIIKAESLAAMTTNQIGKHTVFGSGKYGLGFGLEMGSPAADGAPELRKYFWGGYFSTNFWVDPRHEVVAVIMTQVLPTNHGGALGVMRSGVDGAIER